MWAPTSDDEYDAHYDDKIPSLIPVFDPLFTEAAAVSPVTVDTPIRHETPHITNPDVAPLHSTHDDMTHIHGVGQSLSLNLPDIEPDLDPVDFREWKQWNAPCRIAAIRRWIIHAAHKYGPMERWGEDFGREWNEMRQGDELAVDHWVDGVKARIKMGRNALGYLECAMEGELSTGVEEWRDLYAQSHQLACQLWTAVLGIQYRLDCTMSGCLAS
jgi:hypothetical protein